MGTTFLVIVGIIIWSLWSRMSFNMCFGDGRFDDTEEMGAAVAALWIILSFLGALILPAVGIAGGFGPLLPWLSVLVVGWAVGAGVEFILPRMTDWWDVWKERKAREAEEYQALMKREQERLAAQERKQARQRAKQAHKKAVYKATKRPRRYLKNLARVYALLQDEFQENVGLWSEYSHRVAALCGDVDGHNAVTVLLEHRNWLQRKIVKVRKYSVKVEGIHVIAKTDTSVEQLEERLEHVNELLYEIHQFVAGNISDAVHVNAEALSNLDAAAQARDAMIGNELEKVVQKLHWMVGGLLKQSELSRETDPDVAAAMQELEDLMRMLKTSMPEIKPVSPLVTQSRRPVAAAQEQHEARPAAARPRRKQRN